jgi:hypothetical protein
MEMNYSFEIEQTKQLIERLRAKGLSTVDAESDLRILQSQHNPGPLIDRKRRYDCERCNGTGTDPYDKPDGRCLRCYGTGGS